MFAYSKVLGKITAKGRIAPFYEKRAYRRGRRLTVEFGEFEHLFAIALYCAKVRGVCEDFVKILRRVLTVDVICDKIELEF